VLPNLIIIGAPKAGTTSLHGYLELHPDIFMSAQKELRYFWRDDWREQRSWYESQFTTDAPIRGESTPAYAAYPYRPNVPERMHELVPGAKLIYLVRDPIDRTLSHWVQRRADGDRTSLERYLDEYEDPGNPIICPSRYWMQIERYLRFYDRDQLLVIDQQDLKSRRSETMRGIFRFLGVAETFESPAFAGERNTYADKSVPRALTTQLWDRILWPLSRATPVAVRDRIRAPANRLLFGPPPTVPALSHTMQERLRRFFAPDVESLRSFTGQAFESWSL
jgi:hypothetical protein